MNVPTSMRSVTNAAQQRWQQVIQTIAATFASWRGQSSAAADPSTRLFRGIQRRLILWYGGVLAVILIVAGIVLYVGMQDELFSPIKPYLTTNTQYFTREWIEHGGPPLSCFNPTNHATLYVACYTPDGRLIINNPQVQAGDAQGFLTASLAQSVLKNGPNQDTVTSGNGLGSNTISRYAVVVQDPVSGQTVGVIQVGISIEGEVRALSTLRTLLLLVGLLTLSGSSIGGFILAQRALAPARLAHTRQQAFIADASHELRTPLTLLRTEAEVLLRGRERLTPEDTELVEDIVAESVYLATLTNNLLTLARLDSGTTRVKQDVVDLGEIVATVVHRTTTLAAEKHITLHQSQKSAPTLVLGDQQLLEQVVLILVDNAIKYNVADGEVTVDATQQGQQAIVTVRDTGVGIAPEHLAHLGERFYRPDQARARETGGTGLGLSIAYGIAQAHHGALTLTSTPEQGTLATLSLPTVTVSGI